MFPHRRPATRKQIALPLMSSRTAWKFTSTTDSKSRSSSGAQLGSSTAPSTARHLFFRLRTLKHARNASPCGAVELNSITSPGKLKTESAQSWFARVSAPTTLTSSCAIRLTRCACAASTTGTWHPDRTPSHPARPIPDKLCA